MDRRVAGLLLVALAGAYALQQPSRTDLPSETELRALATRAETEAAVARAAGPTSIEDQLVDDGARVPRLRAPGRLTVPIEYGDGAFYVYDRRRLADFDGGDPWTRALEATFDGRAVAGASGGVLAVMGASGDAGGVPLDIELRSRPPGLEPALIDAATEHDLDLATGDLVSEANGGGAMRVIARLPPGAYRLRLGVRLGSAVTNRGERYSLDLWPRTGARRASRVLRPLAR